MVELEDDPIVFWGAGSQSLVLDAVLRARRYNERVVALLSDTDAVSPLKDVPVIVGKSDIERWLSSKAGTPPSFAVAIGAGHGQARMQKIEFLTEHGLTPRTLTHPTAIILSSNYGRACQILAGSIVGVSVTFEDGVILNTGAQVDHECRIGSGVHIGPGSILAGRVSVGDRTFIGAGATVCPDISIAADCVIGAGSVVTEDITEPGTYVGAPTRRVK